MITLDGMNQMKKQTDKIEHSIEKAKFHARSKKAVTIAFCIAFIFITWLTWKGILTLNRWYDTHRIVTHDIIRVQLHRPISIEERTAINTIPRITPLPTKKPEKIKHVFNFIPDQFEPNRKKVLDQVVKIYGDNANVDAMDLLMFLESKYNPTAKNPTSTAYGMFQFLDETWGQYGCQKTSDVDEQIRCGFLYLKKVYGTPIEAMKHENLYNWY